MAATTLAMPLRIPRAKVPQTFFPSLSEKFNAAKYRIPQPTNPLHFPSRRKLNGAKSPASGDRQSLQIFTQQLEAPQGGDRIEGFPQATATLDGVADAHDHAGGIDIGAFKFAPRRRDGFKLASAQKVSYRDWRLPRSYTHRSEGSVELWCATSWRSPDGENAAG